MIISVASGKGGTGKTLVATSLVLSLKDKNNVQLLDCDVEEPNDHVFLKPAITHSEVVSIPVPKVDEAKCTYCGECAEVCAYNAIAVIQQKVLVFAELCHGCGACSYLCPEKAISEEGKEIGVVESGYSDGVEFAQGRLTIGEAMAPPIIRQVKEHASHEGTVIIDVPPGTSCPVVEAVKGSDFCLLVTEPTPFGLNDLVLAVEAVRRLNIPCGIVLNRAGVGDGKVEEYCLRESIPILLTIPLDIEIAGLYSRGITLVEGIPQWKERFLELCDKIREMVRGYKRQTPMTVRENIKTILSELPNGVELVAAAKTRTPEEVLEAVQSGVKIIGENYVQEAEGKYRVIGSKASWHFIGYLQKNKVKKAVGIFDMIETVDSIEIAREMDKRCSQIAKIMPVLIEINSGREKQKSGVLPEEAEQLIREISGLQHIKVMGLMTMGPRFGNPEDSRPYFVETRKIFEKIKRLDLPDIEMKYLSMGMTNSYKIALEEGANIVRIGAKIFGERD